MAEVTAYRCDICKGLSEDKPKFYLEESSSTFKLKDWSSYRSYDKCACGVDCANAALRVWLCKYEEKSEPDLEAEIAKADRASDKLVGDTDIIAAYAASKGRD